MPPTPRAAAIPLLLLLLVTLLAPADERSASGGGGVRGAVAQTDCPLVGQGIDPYSAGLVDNKPPVYVSVLLKKLIAVDEVQYSYSAYFSIVTTWRDPRVNDTVAMNKVLSAMGPALTWKAVEDCKPNVTFSGFNISQKDACLKNIKQNNLPQMEGCNKPCTPAGITCCDALWIPSLTIPNVILYPQDRYQTESIFFFGDYSTDASAVDRESIVEGTFSSPFTFRRFPFDSQILRLVVAVEGSGEFYLVGSNSGRQSEQGGGQMGGGGGTYVNDEVTGWKIASVALDCTPSDTTVSTSASYAPGWVCGCVGVWVHTCMIPESTLCSSSALTPPSAAPTPACHCSHLPSAPTPPSTPTPPSVLPSPLPITNSPHMRLPAAACPRPQRTRGTPYRTTRAAAAVGQRATRAPRASSPSTSNAPAASMSSPYAPTPASSLSLALAAVLVFLRSASLLHTTHHRILPSLPSSLEVCAAASHTERLSHIHGLHSQARGSRDSIGACLTLFLALVAIQFVIDSQLPRTSAITNFGYLMITSYIVIWLCTMETLVAFCIAERIEKNVQELVSDSLPPALSFKRRSPADKAAGEKLMGSGRHVDGVDSNDPEAIAEAAVERRAAAAEEKQKKNVPGLLVCPNRLLH
ncbi:unnamed protein product [Closterium sp. Naga37s-1]|nr:unnamed protein product [Closterium sp. Naga37s-1]